MSIFALVDCNNFYASCERVFNPALKHKPIVVLSNNDGCVIARSNEAKLLGIPMGAPYFEYQKICKKHNVVVFSSNYTLYGDFSERVMNSLRYHCPEMEVYSIDEAFLQFDKFSHYDLNKYASHIRKKVLMWTGIPVSIGIAPTKTLAKLANLYAKSHTSTGVFDLMNSKTRDILLNDFKVEKIWGIGKKLAEKLNLLGIDTAHQLAASNPKIMRKKFGVVMERIVLELQGISCLSLESMQPRKNIMSSRSFGKLVDNLTELEEAISNYAARACFKLRQQNSKAQGIYVFIQTSNFNEDELRYSNGISFTFSHPTADTCQIIHAAKKALKQIYLPHYQYKKAGIMLLNIVQDTFVQHDMFTSAVSQVKRDKLMQTMDKINKLNNKNTLFIAAQGINRNWQMQAGCKSPNYTTKWDELVNVSC